LSHFTSRVSLAIAAGLVAAFASSVSQAAQPTGTIWLNDFSNNAANCVMCNNGNPNRSTFTVGNNGINYSINDSDVNTVSQMLSGVSGLNAGIGAMHPDNSHITIQGVLALHAGINQLTLTHDDGVRLQLNGSVVSGFTPGPISPTTETVNFNAGAGGNFAFILDYNECCSGPAVLQFQVNGATVGAVPEPATWGMMLLGFAGLGFAFRQSRRKVSFA
jgi:hypothetical protein